MSQVIPLYLYSTDRVSFLKQESFPNSTRFFVVNPKIKPYPSYINIFCVKERTDGSILNITTIYDPFNKTVPCQYKFLAWLKKKSFTIPIYLYKHHEGNLILSLTEKNMTPHTIKTIYVLPEMNMVDSLQSSSLISNSKETDDVIREKDDRKTVYFFIIMIIIFVLILIKINF
jgi:hypothetical protein